MAITAGTAVTFYNLYIKWTDLAGKNFTESDLLVDPNAGGGSTLAADLIQFFTDLDTVGNAQMVTIRLQTITEVLYQGQRGGVGSNPGAQTVDVQMLLKMSRANPLVSGRVINVPYIVPAPREDTTNALTEGPVQKGAFLANTVSNRILTFLNTYLAFRYPGNDIIYGGFTADTTKSKELTVAGSIDPKG